MKYAILFIALFSTLNFTLPIRAQEQNTITNGEITVGTTMSEVLGTDSATNFKDILDPNETIKWTINIPENYNPALPSGTLVQMRPVNLAKIPFGWPPLLNEKNLIWISLNKAGNLKAEKEMLITVLSIVYIQEHYKIDTSRVYIAASKDSCISASLTMQIYPNIFKGVIYTTCEPINWRDKIPPTIGEMKNNGYVFVSSRENEIRRVMQRAEKKYNDAGIKKTKFLNAPNMNYGNSLSAQKFKQAIELLDDLH
ncbi:MAG: hypothetical protein R3D86_12145 [Emcibacteraceae bacterium]